MSKSLKRVRACLEAAGATTDIRETALARTARDAATALGCEVDQIAKSIILRGETSGAALLFITAGGNQIDLLHAAALAQVSPIGHLTPPRAWFDRRLLDFEVIWAAAGTPHHIFGLSPAEIITLSGAQVSDFKI